MQQQAVDGLQRALLDVLVGAVHGVAGLEADDRLPAALGEGGARLLRVAAVLEELGVLLALEQTDRAAEQHLVLGVDGGDAGVLLLVGAVDEARFVLLVVLEGLSTSMTASALPASSVSAICLPSKRLRVLLRAPKRHGQRPGQRRRRGACPRRRSCSRPWS